MSSQPREYRDVLGGVVLIGMGAFAAVYAGSSYSLGTLRQMGPGMFPVILGCVLFGLGVLVLVPALIRAVPATDAAARVEWQPLVMVALSVAVFALTIDHLGLLPAVMLMTLCAAFADNRLKLPGAVLLGGFLAALAILIFKVGLAIPVNIVEWTW